MPNDIDAKSSTASVTKQVTKTIHKANCFVTWFKAIPSVAHIIRAVDRFNDRLGSQFGAAITYFSFLSLIPILMFLLQPWVSYWHQIQICSPNLLIKSSAALAIQT